MIGVLDVVAGLAAGHASACLQLRAQALKPLASMAAYPEGPLGVRMALFGLSLVMGAYAVAVLIGDHDATLTEAVIVGAVAWTAHVMWRNIRRQARAVRAKTQRPSPPANRVRPV